MRTAKSRVKWAREKSRVKWAREKLGLTQAKFAEPMGLAQATINRWESGETPIEKSQALLMQAVHGIREEWLLTGVQPWWLTTNQKAVSPDFTFLERPLLGTSFVEDGGISSIGPMSVMYPLRIDFAEKVLSESGGGSSSDLFYWHVEGESMMPTIRPGELVLLNCSEAATKKILPGGVYLVSRHVDEPSARLRRLWVDERAGVVKATSDNKVYPALTLPLIPDKRAPLIWGRVCWVGRNLLKEDPEAGDW